MSYNPKAAKGVNPLTIHYTEGTSGGGTSTLGVGQQINAKLEEYKIMTTYLDYVDGKYTGPKTAVSAVNVFNNMNTTNKFTQTLKDVAGDVFTYQVAFGNIEVKYTIIHTAPSVYYYRTYNDFAKMPRMA